MYDRVFQQIGHVLGQHITPLDEIECRRRILADVLVAIPVPLFD